MSRSTWLKTSRFGAFLCSTLSWWRSVTISASREDRDRKNPVTSHQINLSKSPMNRSIARFAILREGDKVYDRDSQLLQDRRETVAPGGPARRRLLCRSGLQALRAAQRSRQRLLRRSDVPGFRRRTGVQRRRRTLV